MGDLTSELHRTPRRIRRVQPNDPRVAARAVSAWSLANALAEATKGEKGGLWLKAQTLKCEAEDWTLAQVRFARLAKEIRTRQEALGQRDWVGAHAGRQK